MKAKKINLDELALKRFRNEVDGMFQRFFDEPVLSNMPFVISDLRPACYIVEFKYSYSIEVEIDDRESDDIDIEKDNHILKIRGERKQETEHKDEETEIHSVEHSYGSFLRSSTLPDGINEEEISATDKNGILYINVPKSNESKVRRIKINKDYDYDSRALFYLYRKSITIMYGDRFCVIIRSNTVCLPYNHLASYTMDVLN